MNVNDEIMYKAVKKVSLDHNIDLLDASLKYIEDSGLDFDEFVSMMKRNKPYVEELEALMAELHYTERKASLSEFFGE